MYCEVMGEDGSTPTLFGRDPTWPSRGPHRLSSSIPMLDSRKRLHNLFVININNQSGWIGIQLYSTGAEFNECTLIFYLYWPW